MSRLATLIGCAALAAQLAACAATTGSGTVDGAAVVQFSYESLRPETVRIPAKGSVTWVNLASDSQGFVLFPASAAAAFSCGEPRDSHFQRTAAGYQSRAISSFESEPVALPCPLSPGVYDYEVWIMGTGFGETGAGPERKLNGKIVVE